MAKQKRQYGLWESSLSAEMVAQSAGISDVQWAGDGETLVWLQRRDGRGVLMVAHPGGAPRPINDRLSVRGGVGYGGGEFRVFDDRVFFAADDGRLYRAELDCGIPEPITPEWGSVASPAVSPDGEHVAYVHHHSDVDRIAVVDAEGQKWPSIACEGADFYMHPAFSPDGNELVWVEWDHPNMPWNGSLVCTATVERSQGGLVVGSPKTIAGADDVACHQPAYSPDGTYLSYLTDESGHWQLVLRNRKTDEESTISAEGVEYGGPAWVQGQQFYGWRGDSEGVVAIASKEGVKQVDRLGVDGERVELDAVDDYTAFGQISVSPTGRCAAICSSSSIPARIVEFSDGGDARVRVHSSSERLYDEELADVRPVSWPSGDDGPIETVYGLYYPPTNPCFEADGKPPAIVMIHGGPTSQRVATWEPSNQYFATRGWAVLDVNYRGSTGYGREYMEALFGEWGVLDVDDAIGGAEFLAGEGLADGDRIAVMGGSAGGYTVLQALVTHPGAFKAGVAKYGISNLFELQRGTHKFESHYNDTMVGELPEASEEYRERSPLFSADAIEDAVALFHGSEDEVVPPNQSEMIAESLARRGVPHLHHVYEGEGHGWRRSDTVVDFHERALEFLVEQVVFA